jgi:OOP family OmpA-OmpF porin
MRISLTKALRLSSIVLAMTAAAGLAGCESQPKGQVGQTAVFDVAQASPDDIAKALQNDGRVVLRGTVVFETDSAKLSPAGKDAAARLAEALQKNPNLNVAVVGYTDNTGAFTYNLDLSRRRAEAMANALIRDHGIAVDRIAPVGVGPLSPVASNDTEAGRAQNRRVEVVVIR